VELHAFCPDEADARALPSPPVEVVRYARGRWWTLRPQPVEELADQVRSRKVRLLHALDAGGAELAHRLSAAAERPYIVSSYALGDARRLQHLPGEARAVLAASEQIQRDLLERRVISAGRIHLLRPALVRVRRATCFRAPDHAVAVVAGGPLRGGAGFEAVLKSFAALRDRKYDCVYFVMGSGPWEHRLRGLADELGLKGELTFVASQPADQLVGILKAADLYVSPAPLEELDVQALLAMGAGVPVVSVDSASSDFLKDGRTTLRYKRGDAGELMARLTALLDDHAAARGLAESALEYLGTHHALTDMVARTAEIYRRVVAEAAEGRRGTAAG
jgi:glycosyltransferase involved in cell wall biosynthesis